MKKPVILGALAAAVIAAAGFAHANNSDQQVNLEGAAVGSYLGKTEAEARSALEAKGFVITEIELEDGELELEVKKDAKAYEIEVDPSTGNILEVELEDDND